MGAKSPNQDQSTQSPEGKDESGDGQPLLDGVKEVVGQAGQEALPMLVGTMVDALFSEPVRKRVQEEAEEGLEELLHAAMEALPGNGAAGLERELARTQRKLRLLLHEMIETLFTGSIRAEFQQQMEEVVREMTEGDSTAAKQHAELAGQTLLSAILRVLGSHWSEMLRLLLGVISKALQEALVAHVKEAFAAIAAHPAEAIEEKAGPLQEQVAEKAEELRQRLVETRDAMQERLMEARDRLQERVGGGVSSAMQGGSQGGSQLGRPPSLRPPSGPKGQRPPGKAPGGRPPSISR